MAVVFINRHTTFLVTLALELQLASQLVNLHLNQLLSLLFIRRVSQRPNHHSNRQHSQPFSHLLNQVLNPPDAQRCSQRFNQLHSLVDNHLFNQLYSQLHNLRHNQVCTATLNHLHRLVEVHPQAFSLFASSLFSVSSSNSISSLSF